MMPQLIRIQDTTWQIERIADHAVNIAKDVIYLARGEIVRHRRARARAASCENPD